MMKYEDEDINNSTETRFSYGIITHMYLHRLFHNQNDRIVIVADWFDPVGFDSTGLMQVKYNPCFESERTAFLEDCEPVNFMLWPSNPFEFDWDNYAQSYRDIDQRNVFVVIKR